MAIAWKHVLPRASPPVSTPSLLPVRLPVSAWSSRSCCHAAAVTGTSFEQSISCDAYCHVSAVNHFCVIWPAKTPASNLPNRSERSFFFRTDQKHDNRLRQAGGLDNCIHNAALRKICSKLLNSDGLYVSLSSDKGDITRHQLKAEIILTWYNNTHYYWLWLNVWHKLVQNE